MSCKFFRIRAATPVAVAPTGTRPAGGAPSAITRPATAPVTAVKQPAQQLASNVGSTTQQVTNQVQHSVQNTQNQVNQVVNQVIGGPQADQSNPVQTVTNAAGSLLGH